MPCRVNTCLAIIFIVFISILISNLVAFISIDERIAEKVANSLQNNEEWKNGRKKLQIGNGTEHLMWFVQISDIHISVLQNESRQRDLLEFATKTLDIIKPPVVVASGDLTHAVAEFGSRQLKREWEIYRRVLDDANVRNKTLWLDIRGNHDAFNVPSIEANENLFRKYSVQGDKHKQSYMKQVVFGEEKYSFIAIDACQNPGTKPPYNFMGILDVNQTNAIIDMAEASRKSGGDYIVWFGHYPTSTVLSAGTGNRGLKGILGQYVEGYVYLSGHLHTVYGNVPKLYAIQDEGFLELELGDWKDTRMYRVAAFDHGLFSFVDQKHNSWPVIMVTNPKHALFNIPSKEDPNLQLESTHIRILVFDPRQIISCKFQIDDEAPEKCNNVSDNLYVAPWSPSKYKTGLHLITVTITTNDGASANTMQPFSLDGSTGQFPLGALLILKGSLTTGFQILFGIGLAFCVLPLCILRIWHELIIAQKLSKPKFYGTFWRRCLRKLWILSSVDRMFFPIILIAFYILIGPWSAGYLIDGHLGLIFSWGIFIKGHFIPGTVNYLFGFFQLMLCHFPLIIVYGHVVWQRYCVITGNVKKERRTLWLRIREHSPFIVIILIGYVYMGFRGIATFFELSRFVLLVLDVLLYYWGRTLPKPAFRSAMIVVD